jgi:hypothetical protein
VHQETSPCAGRQAGKTKQELDRAYMNGPSLVSLSGYGFTWLQ